MREIRELIEKLNRYAYEYYTLDNPSISDKEYDELYDRLVKLEKETGIIDEDSPTQKVGGKILDGFSKVIHKNKLWSLDKAQTNKELKEWFDKNERFVAEYNSIHKEKLPPLRYVITKKFDGLTLKCDYEDGKYIQGSTRGTGELGEDITEQVSTIINLPKKLSFKNKISLHGEGLMSKKAFEEYNKTAKMPLKNLRNGVAGALRNLNTSETAKRKCMIYFYNINDCDFPSHFEAYSQQLDFMTGEIPVAEYKICNTYEDVLKEIEEIKKERPNLQYDIDGVVIAIDDMRTRDIMGYTNKFPKFSIAYKFEAEESTTKLLDVEWNTGRTGKVTPKAIIEPVELMGVTVKRATLNNMDDIKRKNVKIGGKVFIRRSNDVIPEIMGNADNEGLEIETPIYCPSCKSVLEKEGAHLFCRNNSCKPQLIKSIGHYASREAMNIDGLSEKTIEKFIEKGFLTSILDLYKLEQYKSQIVKMDGFGLKSYNNLIKSIEKSKQCKLENFVFGLGIPNVGLSSSKDLVNHFYKDNSYITLQEINKAHFSDFIKIKDFGDVVSSSIEYWFDENIGFVNELLNNDYIKFIDKIKEEVFIKENPLLNKSVYPTGKFTLKKDELKAKLELLGAKVENGYKKNLDYLICGGDTSKSGKVDKAKKDGVSLMEEDTLIRIIEEFI